MAASGPARPWWAALGLAAGLFVGTRRLPRLRGGPRLARRARLWVLGGLAAVGVGAALSVAIVGHSGPWAGRLSFASPARSTLASVAFGMWRSHLWTGVGPGRAVFIWSDAQHQLFFDRYAHDEYLQLAVEQGVVGLAGFAALAAGIVATVRRRRPAGGGLDTDLAALRAGAIAGLAAVAVHSAFDFLWHVPAIPLFAALAIGLAAPLAAHPTPTNQQHQEEVPCS
jgi:O-antigen ligase